MTSTHTQVWRDIGSAPFGMPVLVTWLNFNGTPVVGEVWLTLTSLEVEGEMVEWTQVNKAFFCWAFDPDGDEILDAKPTHWMPLPEPPK